MKELKSASDWATERVKDDNPKLFELFIAEIQQNSIEAALELAAVKAKIKVDYKPLGHNSACIDKQSILSLINHPKLKVCPTNEKPS